MPDWTAKRTALEAELAANYRERKMYPRHSQEVTALLAQRERIEIKLYLIQRFAKP